MAPVRDGTANPHYGLIGRLPPSSATGCRPRTATSGSARHPPTDPNQSNHRTRSCRRTPSASRRCPLRHPGRTPEPRPGPSSARTRMMQVSGQRAGMNGSGQSGRSLQNPLLSTSRISVGDCSPRALLGIMRVRNARCLKFAGTEPEMFARSSYSYAAGSGPGLRSPSPRLPC